MQFGILQGGKRLCDSHSELTSRLVLIHKTKVKQGKREKGIVQATQNQKVDVEIITLHLYHGR